MTNSDHSTASQQGFTLIEIMFVVAIVAILAAIALPAYNSYIERGKIKTVQADLTALSLNFENRYQRVLSYPTADYASAADLKAAFNGWAPASATTDFTFSTENTETNSYTLVATGIKGGINGCVIKLEHDGDKTISNCAAIGNGAWL